MNHIIWKKYVTWNYKFPFLFHIPTQLYYLEIAILSTVRWMF